MAAFLIQMDDLLRRDWIYYLESSIFDLYSKWGNLGICEWFLLGERMGYQISK